MSLTLQLPPDLEASIRKAAAESGMAPEAYAVSALHECVRQEVGLPESESQLLEQINVGLPGTIWEQYRELTEKRRDETLTEDERAELLDLTNMVELWNARRLELLLELARLRNVPLRALVEEMGLASAPYA